MLRKQALNDLIAAWSDLQQHVTDEAIDQWRKRLSAGVIELTGNTLSICFVY